MTEFLTSVQKMTKSPLDYNHNYIKIDGYNFHYVDEGPKDGELVLLVHGWPEVRFISVLYSLY
jgi:hypothetical protein